MLRYHSFPLEAALSHVFFLSSVTWSAMPPGRMVFTMTPEVFPPTIPKPRPVPSLTSSIVSRCSNCRSQSTVNTRTALARKPRRSWRLLTALEVTDRVLAAEGVRDTAGLDS